MMDVEHVLNYIFNPATAGPFLVGATVGGTAGFAVAAFLANRLRVILETDLARERDQSDKLSQKLEKLEADFEGEKRGWEYENAHHKAEIERLNARGKTIRCGICGSSMSKTKEYINNNYVGSPKYVDLKCTEQSCGQVLPTSLDDLIRITKKLNGAS